MVITSATATATAGRTATELDPLTIEELQSRVRGDVLHPGKEGYESARKIWNGAVDRRPAAIARCRGVSDILTAVRFARERDLLIAVRGGGHGVAGTAVCDGGLVVDCTPMRGIRVDPLGRTARAEPGVLWGELDGETQAFGLATTAGIVTHTGIAGLTLGGGIGWLMRKHGLTCDNLLSADVVSAEGRFLRASADENPDLFWALRGGGGNFGVVTSFEYCLHPVGPTVLAGPLYFAMDDAGAVLRFYRDFVADAPDELTTIVNLRKAPAVPFLPAQLHGRPVVAVLVCFAGQLEQGERLLHPFRRFGRPLLDLIAPKPYLRHQSMFDPTVPHGWHYYWKSLELPPLTDAVIDRIVEHSMRITSPLSYTLIFQLGGAVARIGEAATAYAHRHAAHSVNINAVWQPGDPSAAAHARWAQQFFAALEPDQVGVYVNFLGDEGDERVRAAYGAAKYRRLAELKRRYDPTNFFRLNQNIKPAE
ncbi:MAG: FAD-binding oxidoreductase [bacterium]